ncbi:MAG: YihY/virulence factor BrkB family protein [Bacteroidaceae bacterium]|nr:YihY/virulence factor BrkB family protein [Bacteroidaceae bacterium]
MSLLSFFREGLLWTIDVSQLPRLRRWALHALRRLVMAVELFVDRNLSAHASALTYSSILGAVPILAIVFAIARGFGFGQLIEQKLTSSVRFTPEMITTIMDFVNSYLERTRGGIFIGIGILLLFYTLISLTSNIENAFNTIWCVKTSRNTYRRIVDYVSVFFLLPIVIVVTSGLQLFLVGIGRFLPSFTFVSDGIEALVQLSPYALTILAFMALYKLMPNTDVHWRSTVVPAVLAGVAFQGLQWFYIHSQVWISSYSAIYGSFAAIPLFMLWMQLSWTICLFGAQLSYAHQMEADFAFEKVAPRLSRKAHDRVALQLMQALCDAFERGDALTAPELAAVTAIPLSLTNTILYEFTADERHPLVSEVMRGRRDKPRFQPARPVETLTPEAVVDYLNNLGDDYQPLRTPPTSDASASAAAPAGPFPR